MRPIEFKGQNIIFAKDQPEYLPLPALRQLTFNQPLQPIRPIVELSDDIYFTTE